MSNRTTESYKAVFDFIESRIFKLEPTGLMTDWEAGMRNALRVCYPEAILRGCWYHFCAAIRKKCLMLGLHSILKYEADARLIKFQITSLPLLPPESFEEGYEYIKNMAKDFDLFSTFQALFSYFEGYWIGQVLPTKYNLMDLNVNVHFLSVLTLGVLL